MRREKREMPSEWALEVFDKAPYITVSMVDMEQDKPYAVPLSLCRTDEKTFYFHCAQEGLKLDLLKVNPNVCLSAVTKCAPTVGPQDNSFTLQFKSAIAFGTAEIVEDDKEKVFAMRAICQRFLPNHMAFFDESIQRSLHRTCVVKVVLTVPPTGKRKEYDSEGKEKTKDNL